MWFLQEGMTLEKALVVISALLVTIFVILPIHEWAHGFVAYKLGDNTAKNSGRLTLNPLKHIDPLGASALLLFKFGWARPVPVDPRNFKRPKLGMALTALAGPLSNLIVALIFMMISFAVFWFREPFISWMGEEVCGQFIGIMFLFADVNVGLAVFNLLPLPPLDGSKIFAALLPDKFLSKYYQYEHYITLAVFVLLFAGVFSVPLALFKNFIFNKMASAASLPFEHLFYFFGKG